MRTQQMNPSQQQPLIALRGGGVLPAGAPGVLPLHPAPGGPNPDPTTMLIGMTTGGPAPPSAGSSSTSTGTEAGGSGGSLLTSNEDVVRAGDQRGSKRAGGDSAYGTTTRSQGKKVFL